MINLASSLAGNVALHPDKHALHWAGRSMSYAQLDAAACQFANGLRAIGIGKGDKVALACRWAKRAWRHFGRPTAANISS